MNHMMASFVGREIFELGATPRVRVVLDFRFAAAGRHDTRPNAEARHEWFGARDSIVATRPPAV